jgi:aminoglycoside phosphotransferase (APT) family kinase protein
VVRVSERQLVDVGLVRRLVAAQFPQWAGLPIQPVAAAGWDNQTFHLGDTMSVRLPTAATYALAVEKEHRWLPMLAPQLPLPIPAPVGRGVPGEGYPHPWSIYRWLAGEPAAIGRIADLNAFARDVGGFLTALQRIDATGGPGPGQHSWFRGGPLTAYDRETREAIAALGDQIPAALATEIWETALKSRWERPPVWFHGDIAVGNLLVRDGRLAAVIDFGTSGVGDPACDMVLAWTRLTGESRETFRTALGVDEDTWARGRGWALWKALITYDESTAVLDEIFGAGIASG